MRQLLLREQKAAKKAAIFPWILNRIPLNKAGNQRPPNGDNSTTTRRGGCPPWHTRYSGSRLLLPQPVVVRREFNNSKSSVNSRLKSALRGSCTKLCDPSFLFCQAVYEPFVKTQVFWR